MAEETTVAATWLIDRLTTDPTLTGLVGQRVFDSQAPRGTAYPFIIFQYQGGQDVRGVGPARIMAGMLWVVKAVGRTKSYASLDPIASRIDAVLHAQHGSVGGGTVVACVREQPFKLEESDGGVAYRHLGGIYCIYAQ